MAVVGWLLSLFDTKRTTGCPTLRDFAAWGSQPLYSIPKNVGQPFPGRCLT